MARPRKTKSVADAFSAAKTAFEDLEAAIDAELGSDGDGDDGEEEEEEEAPARRRKKTSSKKTSSKKTSSKKTSSRKSDDDDPGIDQVREAMLEVLEEHGNDESKRILKKFGAKRVSELEEDDYADVVAACKASLEESEEEED